MICYIDSSAVLRIIFNSDNAFRDYDCFEKIGSSELMVIECNRVIDRYRLENILSDAQIATAKEYLHNIIEGMYILDITHSIKARASDAFPTVVGTLDALHISTAVIWREESGINDFSIVSHEKQMNVCAKALGFKIIE